MAGQRPRWSMNILVAIYSPFVSWCIPESRVEWLRGEFPEHTVTRTDTDEETRAAIGDADVAFSSQIKASHVAAARRLRWVHSPAAGVGSMLFPEMVHSRIVLTNSRGNSAVTIAEHTIAVTLGLLRNLPLAWRRQAERTWAQHEFNAGARIRTLRGLRVLIVGLGSIGAATARLAAGFGAEVVGMRRRVDLATPEGVSLVVPPSALHDHLQLADVVILAAPQTPLTVHLLGQPELERMKPGALLINVSRGKLVDERALLDALASGRLGGAALDVFEHEPLSPDSPLWVRDDVLITPHVSGFHADYWPETVALFADNLRRFAVGAPLRNVVDKQAGY
jgi:phosphoglycerate dehydrogenase-like enzyme